MAEHNDQAGAADQATLVLDGDLTASVAGTIRRRIKALIAGGVRKLLVDMGACTMADSSGIGLLVAAHNSLAGLGGSLGLIHVSKDLQELFQTMRLHQHFSISE